MLTFAGKTKGSGFTNEPNLIGQFPDLSTYLRSKSPNEKITKKEIALNAFLETLIKNISQKIGVELLEKIGKKFLIGLSGTAVGGIGVLVTEIVAVVMAVGDVLEAYELINDIYDNFDRYAKELKQFFDVLDNGGVEKLTLQQAKGMGNALGELVSLTGNNRSKKQSDGHSDGVDPRKFKEPIHSPADQKKLVAPRTEVQKKLNVNSKSKPKNGTNPVKNVKKADNKAKKIESTKPTLGSSKELSEHKKETGIIQQINAVDRRKYIGSTLNPDYSHIQANKSSPNFESVEDLNFGETTKRPQAVHAGDDGELQILENTELIGLDKAVGYRFRILDAVDLARGKYISIAQGDISYLERKFKTLMLSGSKAPGHVQKKMLTDLSVVLDRKVPKVDYIDKCELLVPASSVKELRDVIKKSGVGRILIEQYGEKFILEKIQGYDFELNKLVISKI
jgi:hypothetical protein